MLTEWIEMCHNSEYSLELKMVDTVFMFMPDAAIQKAWLLYKKSCDYQDKPPDFWAFRAKKVNIYRMKYST